MYTVQCTLNWLKLKYNAFLSFPSQWSELDQSGSALCPHRQEISPVYGLASFMPLLSRLVKVIEPYMYIRARLRLAQAGARNINF